MSSVLVVETTNRIATLTLNRPDYLNALNRELRERLAEAFISLGADNETSAIILTGAGRSFCAGMDLKEAAEGKFDEAAFHGEEDIVGAMASFKGPVIGAINGYAVTAGFELALNCDILIASNKAKFADTHVRVGMLPGWGLSQRLSRMIGISRAKEISLSGNYISAEQAESWGLVNRVVKPDQLLPTCMKLAEEMASCDPVVISTYKRLINEGYEKNLGQALEYESTLAKEWARNITSGQIARNRGKVQKRGKQQTT